MSHVRFNGLSLTRVLSTVFALVLVTLALACPSPPPAVEIPSTPHPIVVVDIDSLRADHLGCYGYQRATSPNIDALAAESVRFEWAFAQAPNTAPSQASILTSLYPSTHGMINETTRLPDNVVTLAEALAEAGYTTAAFVDGGYLSEDFGFAQGFSHWDNNRGAGIAGIGPKVLAWLDGHHNGGSFFLFVHTYDVHVPFDPPAAHRDLFTAGLEPPNPGFAPDPEQMEAARTALLAEEPQPLPGNDLAHAIACYDGEIHYVDAWIGELVAKLRALGLDSSTTIVLLSDHGEELQEHGDLMHERLYTTVTRVPLILRLPHGHRAGVASKLVETIDLMPTLLELAGVPVPPGAQGDSLVPMIKGVSNPPYLAFGESAFFGGQRFAALGGYHLIHTVEGDTAELYNLATDPLELSNLIEAEPERAKVLRQHLDQWQEEALAAAVDGSQDSEIDQETYEQLKGLGYIQ